LGPESPFGPKNSEPLDITSNLIWPAETYIGELHFDLDSGEIFVIEEGKKDKIKIKNINNFKKLATKKLLRR